MLKRYHQGFGLLCRLLDVGIVVGAWLCSYWARFAGGPFPVTKGLPPFSSYAALAPLVAVLWIGVFQWMRVYQPHRMLGRLHELGVILKANGIALLLLIAITYLFEEYKYSRLVIVYFGVLSAASLAAFRVTLRTALRAFRAHGYNLRHVLAVGEGEALEWVIQRLERFPELGLRVLGVVTRDSSRDETAYGRPVLGHFEELVDIVRSAKADEVIIALPAGMNHEVDQVLELLKDETVDVRLVPDVNRYVTLGCEVDDFDGLPVVSINDSPLVGTGALAKRATDFVLALFALIVLSPLLLSIALAVRLSSPGPILYVQERMGLDGRSFRMLKFRSMKIDAEMSGGPQWAQKNDDRRTALGTFLRKTSLDELPQLWNVLLGEMALVGPRPERPYFVQTFRTQIPRYMLRHKVRAGITGWAQVNGWRGNTSLERRIECDLFYIKNWSYVLDLKILVMTVWRGFINKNAY